MTVNSTTNFYFEGRLLSFMKFLEAVMSRKTPKTIAEGEWLIEAMEQAGMSNAQLAEKLGMEYDNLVSQWRNGSCPMSDLSMLRAAQVLRAEPYSARPILLAYVDAIQGQSILSGLSKEGIDRVLGIVALVRSQQAAEKAPKKAKPNIVAAEPAKKRRKSS